MRPHLDPVYNKGELQLYDIWIDDVWHGSRRTYDQCIVYLNHVFKKALTK